MTGQRYRGANYRVPKGCCRWCGEVIDRDLHPRARSWHPACVREWEDQRPDVMRHRVWKRDGGRCQVCGTLVSDLEARLRGFLATRLLARSGGVPTRALRMAGRMAGATGLPRHLARVATGEVRGWAMDHREPLWAGGANTLDNCQLLCVTCHRDKTAREATERAAQARRQLALEAP